MGKNTKRKLKDAAYFGMKITVSEELNQYSGKVLFPEKLKMANEVVEKLVDKSGKRVFKSRKKTHEKSKEKKTNNR